MKKFMLKRAGLLLELESASWSLNNKYLIKKNWSFLTKKYLVSNNLGLELDPNSARKHNRFSEK
jgi:hypothetical protein